MTRKDSRCPGAAPEHRHELPVADALSLPLNSTDAEALEVPVLVEDDPDTVSPFAKDTAVHALYSALVTLTLGVLGSTVLPVPYAFSKTGVAAGALTMAAVAATNDATCCMMIRAAAHTGFTTYEELAGWAGGRRARVFTQVSLLLLLYGTLCGGLAFLSDVARVGVRQGLGPGAAPALMERDGRPLMVGVVATVLLPLCLQRHIRQFEKAATVGVVVVVALCAVIVGQAVRLGFPAVRSGELAVLSLQLDPHLPEAFAVLGFAFYMQPMLMPLLKEMPPGPLGTRLTERAVHITLFGVACGVYGTVGIFGAAIFGAKTESNIMVNDLLPGSRTPTLLLYGALLGYLCCGMVTTHYALRASLDLLLAGEGAPYRRARHVAETLGILGAAMAVALLFPTQAEKIFALTGCTAVCLVCYVIPVYIHLAVQRDVERLAVEAAKAADAAALAAPRAALASASPPDVAPLAASGEGARPASYAHVAAAARAAGGASASLRQPLLAGGADCEAAGEGAGCPGRPGCLAGGCSGSSASGGGGSGCGGALLRRYGGPAAILAVGVGFSVAGLYVGLTDLLAYLREGEGGKG